MISEENVGERITDALDERDRKIQNLQCQIAELGVSLSIFMF